MHSFLQKLDELANIETEDFTTRWLERVAFIFLILMFVSAPHSIAATQIAWLTGMFIWVVRMIIKPRPRLIRTALDVPLWLFFIWSIVSSIFSYDPPTSLDKLRNVALFLIFYFVINLVRTRRAVVLLAFAMILSCMVSVIWTPVERIIGRGVEVSGVSAESPLIKSAMLSGDTLLKADGVKIKTPEQLLTKLESQETTKITFYRPDFYLTVDVPRANLLAGTTAYERIGFTDWKRGRNWRSAGFYGHYTTFAEVLQLIASLTLGLLIAIFITRRREDSQTQNEIGEDQPSWFFAASPRRRIALSVLVFCVGAMGFALLLTVTRASQLGFLIAAMAMIFAAGNRKMLLIAAAIILPIALGGLIFLQQSREVGFFDLQDESIKYRLTIYGEAFHLWTQNPRHFFLGVGMDSIKKFAPEWRLFDDGRLPIGHFHSTPIQLLVERGLPALLLWLWILWTYALLLWKKIKMRDADFENPKSFDWREKGIIIGCFGGTIGFFAASLVHYNLGDAEVAMVFFMLMGLSVSLITANLKLSTKTDPDIGNA